MSKHSESIRFYNCELKTIKSDGLLNVNSDDLLNIDVLGNIYIYVVFKLYVVFKICVKKNKNSAFSSNEKEIFRRIVFPPLVKTLLLPFIC